MDQDTLDNIFIPFFTKKEGGTGLGMPSVKKAVEAHRGKIRVWSRPGLGTEVAVTLPFRGPSPLAPKNKPSEPSQSRTMG